MARKNLTIHLLIAAGFAVAGAWGIASAARGPKDLERFPKTGAAVVRVAFPDNTPAPGALIVAGGKVLTADGNGSLELTGVPAMYGVVSAETTRKEGGLFGLFRQEVRYASFATYDGKAGNPLEFRLTLSRYDDMDRLCRSCHPEQLGQERAVVRCVHKAGIPLKPAQVKRTSEFNEENERLRASGKTFYPRIEPAFRKSGIFSEKKAILVCTTCHSKHIPTGSRAYVLVPFEEKSILCRGCHV